MIDILTFNDLVEIGENERERMDEEKKKEFLQFLDYVDNFIDGLEGGESYFMHKGKRYSADMGYVLDFWRQFYDILKEEFSE